MGALFGVGFPGPWESESLVIYIPITLMLEFWNKRPELCSLRWFGAMKERAGSHT